MAHHRRNDRNNLYPVGVNERRLIDKAFEKPGLPVTTSPDVPPGSFLDSVDDDKRVRQHDVPFAQTKDCRSKTIHIVKEPVDPNTANLGFEFPEVFQETDTDDYDPTPVALIGVGTTDPQPVLRALAQKTTFLKPIESLAAFCMSEDVAVFMTNGSEPKFLLVDDARNPERHFTNDIIKTMMIERFGDNPVFEPVSTGRIKGACLRANQRKRKEVFPWKMLRDCRIRKAKQLLRRR